jgi:hypothetical protein
MTFDVFHMLDEKEFLGVDKLVHTSFSVGGFRIMNLTHENVRCQVNDKKGRLFFNSLISSYQQVFLNDLSVGVDIDSLRAFVEDDQIIIQDTPKFDVLHMLDKLPKTVKSQEIIKSSSYDLHIIDESISTTSETQAFDRARRIEEEIAIELQNAMRNYVGIQMSETDRTRIMETIRETITTRLQSGISNYATVNSGFAQLLRNATDNDIMSLSRRGYISNSHALMVMRENAERRNRENAQDNENRNQIQRAQLEITSQAEQFRLQARQTGFTAVNYAMMEQRILEQRQAEEAMRRREAEVAAINAIREDQARMRELAGREITDALQRRTEPQQMISREQLQMQQEPLNVHMRRQQEYLNRAFTRFLSTFNPNFLSRERNSHDETN